jgi:hypothetical protein
MKPETLPWISTALSWCINPSSTYGASLAAAAMMRE